MQLPVFTARSPAQVFHERRGFTLIELMITIAVLAIIAAVALPSYFDSIRKSRRADAINALTRAQQAQERFRANNAAYGPLFVNVNTATFAVAASGAASGVQTFDGPDGYYTVDVVNGSDSATGYTVLATAKAGTSQANDRGCQCLQLAASGGQFTYSAGGPNGAFDGNPANCGAISAGAGANRCWRK
jgi:type IV pilus assembly protein PilE